MRSSWRPRGTRSPRTNLTAGGILLAVGLWDLFFVLFRSEDGAFTVSTALLLLAGSFTSCEGLSSCGRKGPGSDPSEGSSRRLTAPEAAAQSREFCGLPARIQLLAWHACNITAYIFRINARVSGLPAYLPHSLIAANHGSRRRTSSLSSRVR
jgi:hypothetical protein